MIVPPPMCAYSVQLPSFARNVTFCPTNNQLAALTATGDVTICRLGYNDGEWK